MTSEQPPKSLQDRARELLQTTNVAGTGTLGAWFDKLVRPILVELAVAPDDGPDGIWTRNDLSEARLKALLATCSRGTVVSSHDVRHLINEVRRHRRQIVEGDITDVMKPIAEKFGLELRICDVVCGGRDEQRIQVIDKTTFSEEDEGCIYVGTLHDVEAFLRGFEWRQRILDYQHKAQPGVIITKP